MISRGGPRYEHARRLAEKHEKTRLCIKIYLLLDSYACETRYLASLLRFSPIPEVEDLPQRRRGTSRQEMMLYERDPPLIREDVLEWASFKRCPAFGLLGSPK